MQIFIVKGNSEFLVNSAVYAKFDGKKLRTYLNNQLVDTKSATIGNVFSIELGEGSKPILVKKEKMPKTRGEKIAWSLGFQKKNTFANSFNNFWHTLHYLLETTENSRDINTEHIEESYAFAVAIRKTPPHKGRNGITLIRKILIWISDDISEADLEQLISDLKKYEKISCSTEFLKVL